MILLITYALGYGMGPGALPVILPVTAPRNRVSEYLSLVTFILAQRWLSKEYINSTFRVNQGIRFLKNFVALPC